MKQSLKTGEISHQLKQHALFTAIGALSGLVTMVGKLICDYGPANLAGDWAEDRILDE